MNFKGLFIKINIENLVEVSNYFDAICDVSNENFTGVCMLENVQRKFSYLGTFDGEHQVFTTKVKYPEQIITLDQLKKINYVVYVQNKA